MGRTSWSAAVARSRPERRCTVELAEDSRAGRSPGLVAGNLAAVAGSHIDPLLEIDRGIAPMVGSLGHRGPAMSNFEGIGCMDPTWLFW